MKTFNYISAIHFVHLGFLRRPVYTAPEACKGAIFSRHDASFIMYHACYSSWMTARKLSGIAELYCLIIVCVYSVCCDLLQLRQTGREHLSLRVCWRMARTRLLR